MKYILHSLLVLGLVITHETMPAAGRAGSKGDGNKSGNTTNYSTTVTNNTSFPITAGSTTINAGSSQSVSFAGSTISIGASGYTSTPVPAKSGGTITVTGASGSNLSANGTPIPYTGTTTNPQTQGTAVTVSAWKNAGTITLKSPTSTGKDANNNLQYAVTIRNNADGSTKDALLTMKDLTPSDTKVISYESANDLGLSVSGTGAITEAP